jgi:Glycosyl hydrolase family 57
MNAALKPTPLARPTQARLHLFSVFHCNLAFSSIEERDRAAVISRCYWPMLSLAALNGPIGIEATGYTLEEIAARDMGWIGRLKELITAGKIELVGSGYAQIIGPLVPARVLAANLAIGNAVYRKLLGIEPTLALVNEQAYSGGIVGAYLDAGYRALLMDWDNPAAAHPEWDPAIRYAPQRALGPDGRSIGLLWTNTVAFQKLQRFAHGDISLEEYAQFVATARADCSRALCLYASDAEVFDYRPGRYRGEEKLSGNSEWGRIAGGFAALRALSDVAFVAPSDALALAGEHAPALRLETAAHPVPVKKQRKYNLTRWAVTGRDDIGINAACERIAAALSRNDAPESEWKRLCRLWSSDFRTHITADRWTRYCAELKRTERDFGIVWPPGLQTVGGTPLDERFIEVKTRALTARLDRRRGLAIQRLAFGDGVPVVGGLPHGHFDDIALQADWYTGDCVFECPGEAKVTDLDWAETTFRETSTGDVVLAARIPTPLGPIEKILTFHAGAPCVDFDITFHWQDFGKGSLRLGHVTLLPDAFNWNRLQLATHNGGTQFERFALAGQTVEHGAAVSFLVSASSGLGMTEGWAELFDEIRGVRVEVDRGVAPLLGLLTHRQAGGSLFCQLVLSLLELDDTTHPTPYRRGPRRAKFSISAGIIR